MKHLSVIVGLLILLILISLSGCISNNDSNGVSDSESTWEDGAFTLQNIEYTEKYSSTIGDYRTADIWFKIDYDVYIDTEIQCFSLTTSKGETTDCRFGIGCGWECQKDGATYRSGGTVNIPISKADSPGSLTIHLYYDGLGEKQLYNLGVDETIVCLNYEIEDAYGTTQYLVPIQ